MTRWLWYPIFSFYFGTFCRRISFCVGECIWNMYLRVPVHCATSWCRMCKFELVSESWRALQGMLLLVHFQRNKYVTLYRLAAVRFTLGWHCCLLWRHQLSWLLWSVVVMGARYLIEEGVVTLLNASDSEEDISEEENHTSNDSIHPTSESDCDTSDSEDDRDDVQSKGRKIT